MKRSGFYIILIIFAISAVVYAHKRGYRFGMKDGRNKLLLEQTKLLLEQNTATALEQTKTISNDPNKPTIRMMTINCGDDIPPQWCEVAPLHEIIRERYNIEYVDNNPDILLDAFMPKHKAPTDPKIIKIFYTSEVYFNKYPKQFLDSYDLVLGFDFIDRPNYIRLPFQYVGVRDKIRHDYDRKMKCDPASKKHFACFLVSNGGEKKTNKFDGALARTRMFHRLSLYKKVLSGGKHLNNVGGPVGDTMEFFSQCKFTLSFENTLDYPGYVTEKPFMAWLGGTVPIYNTDPAGLVDINKKAVIYAGDFKTEEELVDYIIKVDNDDKLYCDIWNQQIVDNPEKDYEVIKHQIRKKLFEILDKRLK